LPAIPEVVTCANRGRQSSCGQNTNTGNTGQALTYRVIDMPGLELPFDPFNPFNLLVVFGLQFRQQMSRQHRITRWRP
jgi:hypothetical protein